MILKEGSLLKNGDYRIGKVLGQGGFGITYLADQVALGRKVAVKEFFMKEHCNRDEDSSVSVGSIGSKGLVENFKAKFMKEARMIAALSNPHIISIYDIFEENGTAYYVMEYLEGKSLSALVRERGVLSEADAVMYTRHIADALNEVHANNLLHLDVKPVNVMLNKKGEAVLIDFGISKHYDEAGGQTSSGLVGLSEGYAPMEQYKTGGISSFSPSTDIYSLGATLYKLLTGKTPPHASDVNDDGLPPFPVNISAPVRAAVTAAMQPRRKERPQSVDEFLALLDSEPAAAPDTVVADDNGETRIVADRTEKTEIAATLLSSGQNAHVVEPADARAQVGNNAGKPAGENKQPTGAKPKKRRVFLWVLLFVVLAAAGVLYFVLPGNSNPAIEAAEEFLDNPTVENVMAVAQTVDFLDEEQFLEFEEWLDENINDVVAAAIKGGDEVIDAFDAFEEYEDEEAW